MITADTLSAPIFPPRARRHAFFICAFDADAASRRHAAIRCRAGHCHAIAQKYVADSIRFLHLAAASAAAAAFDCFIRRYYICRYFRLFDDAPRRATLSRCAPLRLFSAFREHRDSSPYQIAASSPGDAAAPTDTCHAAPPDIAHSIAIFADTPLLYAVFTPDTPPRRFDFQAFFSRYRFRYGAILHKEGYRIGDVPFRAMSRRRRRRYMIAPFF